MAAKYNTLIVSRKGKAKPGFGHAIMLFKNNNIPAINKIQKISAVLPMYTLFKLPVINQ